MKAHSGGFDPVRIIDALARHGVEFIIIGGFAAELYQAPIPLTQDIDVTPRMSASNLSRLSAALDDLRARIRVAEVPEGLAFSHDASSLARAVMWNLTTLAGDFDISFRPTGTDGYEDLVTNSVVVDIADHDVALAALADVVRSKEAAGRPKDLATLVTLHRWRDALSTATADDIRAGVRQALDRRSQIGAEPGNEER